MIGLLVMLIAAACAHAGEAVKKIDLLPFSAENQRNDGNAFVQLKDGRLMLIYSHYLKEGKDDAPAHLCARFSKDGGLTWTDKDELVVANEGGINVMESTLTRLKNGDIALFNLRMDSLSDCRTWMRTSRDEGKSWSKPQCCMAESSFFVVNNDRVVQLKSGRLVIPAADHAEAAKVDWKNELAVAVCYLSDDNGATWRRGKQAIRIDTATIHGLQEPGVVELKDGRLFMFCRTDKGCQYGSYSRDGGETWTTPQPTSLVSPLSPASIKRIPKTGDLLAVWNNTTSAARDTLSLAYSRDDGQTWEGTRLIEPGDGGNSYCYTAITFVKDRVVLAYRGGGSRMPLQFFTRLAVFDLDWLYQKQ